MTNRDRDTRLELRLEAIETVTPFAHVPHILVPCAVPPTVLEVIPEATRRRRATLETFDRLMAAALAAH